MDDLREMAMTRQSVTCATYNFKPSSKKNRNVEFGLLVQDSGLAESVETTMTGQHGGLYQLV